MNLESTKPDSPKLEYLNRQYGVFFDWYKQSEQKATFLVTINTFVAGVINGLVFLAPEKLTQAKAAYTAPVWMLLTFSGIASVGSLIFILRSVWARHRGSAPKLEPTQKLWFFGDLAKMGREDHQKLIKAMSEKHMEDTMTAQNYLLACNVQKKFDALNIAISLTVVSLILLFALGFAYAGSHK